MKVLIIVLLCALAAAVQGRSAVASRNNNALAALGEKPYIVHIRIAVSTSGQLNTCAGSFIGDTWVITAPYCINNVRYMWVSFGVVDVINPSLVLETTVARRHPFYALALVNTNRPVQITANISPVSLYGSGGAVPDETEFCIFGANDAGDGPGRRLKCFDVTLEETEELEIVAYSNEGAATMFDYGAPLVNANGIQIGILAGRSNNEHSGIFFPIDRQSLTWIQGETNITIIPEIPDGSKYAGKVNFVS